MGTAVILAVALLAAGQAVAERLNLQDYPDMGNVHPGCSGVSMCIVYVSGGGTATTAEIQTDLRTLAAGMPSGVGIVAYRPTGSFLGFLVYSPSDISEIRTDAGIYSPQFGSRLTTVSVSEGVRAARYALNSYVQQVGPWIEIDQFSPLMIPSLDTTKIYQVIASYSADWPTVVQSMWSTGPSDFAVSSDRYSIILSKGSALDIYGVHGKTIGLALVDANGTLIPAMSDDLVGMRYTLLLQHAGQWVASPTASGVPGVTSPPQGAGPGAPSEGGGVGIESFPAWLTYKKVGRVQSKPH